MNALGPLLLLLSSTALAGSMAAFLVREKRGRPFSYYLALGVAWQFALGLPVGLVQMASPSTLGGVEGAGPWRAVAPLVGAPFNVGGLSARMAFEAMDGPPRKVVVGQATMPSPIARFAVAYFPVLLAQVLAVAAVYAAIARRRGAYHPVAAGLGILVLANSLANLGWAWWGR